MHFASCDHGSVSMDVGRTNIKRHGECFLSCVSSNQIPSSFSLIGFFPCRQEGISHIGLAADASWVIGSAPSPVSRKTDSKPTHFSGRITADTPPAEQFHDSPVLPSRFPLPWGKSALSGRILSFHYQPTSRRQIAPFRPKPLNRSRPSRRGPAPQVGSAPNPPAGEARAA